MRNTLAPKQAKRLTSRTNKPYKMIEDQDGQEWLVGCVLDNGRLMELWKTNTNGKVRKVIPSREYCNYKIILGEEDLE